MDDRTREYLKGRFGDYYRGPRRRSRRTRTSASGATSRGPRVGHDDAPASVAVRSGRRGHVLRGQRAPSRVLLGRPLRRSRRVDDVAEGWRSADLVFDLDADHLPGVDPDATSYPEMLAECKQALLRLLDFLEDDFSFDDLTVVFSGGRGYHVHVRDESVRELDSEARREVVDYVRAIDLDTEGLIRTVSERGTTKRVLRTEGGWGASPRGP